MVKTNTWTKLLFSYNYQNSLLYFILKVLKLCFSHLSLNFLVFLVCIWYFSKKIADFFSATKWLHLPYPGVAYRFVISSQFCICRAFSGIPILFLILSLPAWTPCCLKYHRIVINIGILKDKPMYLVLFQDFHIKGTLIFHIIEGLVCHVAYIYTKICWDLQWKDTNFIVNVR